MKKLFKGLVIIILSQFIIGFGFLGWMYSSLIVPSFKDTGIIFTDIFKKDLEPEKYEKFEENIMLQADILSNKSVDKIKKGINKLFPAPNFDYSNIPGVEYPYPSLDEVVKSNEDKSLKGLQDGLSILQTLESDTKKAISEGLKHLEDSSGND